MNTAEETTQLLKQLYDTTKSIETKLDNNDDDALPELIVKDFDEEQIWQELELQNAARFKRLANHIKKFTKSDLIFLDQFNGEYTHINVIILNKLDIKLNCFICYNQSIKIMAIPYYLLKPLNYYVCIEPNNLFFDFLRACFNRFLFVLYLYTILSPNLSFKI